MEDTDRMRVIGILNDENGDVVLDYKGGPVRVLAEEDCEYTSYSQFHGTPEWQEWLDRIKLQREDYEREKFLEELMQ